MSTFNKTDEWKNAAVCSGDAAEFTKQTEQKLQMDNQTKEHQTKSRLFGDPPIGKA